VAKLRILLLTNRDSDNIGDQIIEASAIALIRAAMLNLDIPDFSISSRAAGMVTRKYMETRDPVHLESARKSIAEADVIVFGGAPLFNYAYQSFYLRTIITLELAQEYGVPVLFSSIGVEPFDFENSKSLALRDALHLPCVRQITTRDDFRSLDAYVEGTNIPIAHVADPAVFADIVFDQVADAGAASDSRPVVGLVATRAGIFADNGIDFSEDDQRHFWLECIDLLTSRGYDYRIFTTGHFTDEVFLDSLMRESSVDPKKVGIPINSPEELIRELRQCSGLIAYRLHASITAFAFDIPSIGLSWNFKVPYFYQSVNYPERALEPERWNADEAVSALEQAMADGVKKDPQFLMTVYETLFAGLQDIFDPDSEEVPFTYSELRERLPRYSGTTERQYREKISRKLRRTYENYQKLRRAAAAAR